jgi:hypothetical protein
MSLSGLHGIAAPSAPPSLDGACDHAFDDGLLSEEEEDHDRDHCHEYGRELRRGLREHHPVALPEDEEGEQEIVPNPDAVQHEDGSVDWS